MKTYNGKTITKKEIERILRTEDSTQIYKLFARIVGWVPDRRAVYEFVCNHAPSNRVYRNAFAITYPQKHTLERLEIEKACIIRHGFYKGAQRHNVAEMLRREIKEPDSPYAKRPMLGKTNLYFCSPIYGHDDYNKRRMMPIEGNERFCALVIKIADRYFNPVYHK